MNSDDEKKKFDVIDFIIDTLREHEHALDDLVKQLETIVSRAPAVSGASAPAQGVPSVGIRDWEEFKSRCSQAPLVAYEETEAAFSVDAMKLGLRYSYIEELPLMRVKVKRVGDSYVTEQLSSNSPDNAYPLMATKLKCGLEGRIESTRTEAETGVYFVNARVRLNDEEVRGWLAEQLSVDEKNVIKGRLAT